MKAARLYPREWTPAHTAANYPRGGLWAHQAANAHGVDPYMPVHTVRMRGRRLGSTHCTEPIRALVLVPPSWVDALRLAVCPDCLSEAGPLEGLR